MNERSHAVISPLQVIVWSLPSLLSVLLFTCTFPIGRQLMVWQHQTIAEIFFYWFLTISPITTIVAMIRVTRYSRRKQLQTRLQVIAWALIVLSVTLNGVVLVGLLTAFYY